MRINEKLVIDFEVNDKIKNSLSFICPFLLAAKESTSILPILLKNTLSYKSPMSPFFFSSEKLLNF